MFPWKNLKHLSNSRPAAQSIRRYLEYSKRRIQGQNLQNCTELNKDYKGGVAISSSTKNKGGKTKYKPYVSKELYNANKKSDRDKDGIACEK